jgi:hypothetical protein
MSEIVVVLFSLFVLFGLIYLLNYLFPEISGYNLYTMTKFEDEINLSN